MSADIQTRFSTQHALLLTHHDQIADLRAAEDRQDSALTEIQGAILDWEDAHNRSVAYSEGLEARIADLARRLAETEDLVVRMVTRIYAANWGA